MKCDQQLVCPFYRRKIAIHDAMYKTNLAKYCEGDFNTCAIYQVMKAATFLKVPNNLYPNQDFRVKEILEG